MNSMTIDELAQLVVRLHLVEPSHVDECVAGIGPAHRTPADLMQALESKNYLTSYQARQIARGEANSLLLGRYKIMYRNASGSFARVFRACSITDNRMVGLKVLRQRWAGDLQAVAQFHREAELCRQLRHKNIVPIYEVGHQGDHHYFTMEFVEGGNLRDFLKIRGKISPGEASRCLLEMAEGLEYALSKGITHRDLKLSNVLMSSRGVAKLVDFGLAGNEGLLAGSGSDSVQRALEYAALEKGSNAPINDPRSDLYFLGTIYYELLTGTPPYPRTRSRQERKDVARYMNIRPIHLLDSGIPRGVEAIVERLIEFSPNQRYQSPTEVITDIRAVLEDLGESPQALSRRTASGAAGNGRPESPRSLPTVMCIENRVKQQDMLREYLSKRGFRVLVLSDLERGLSRLRSTPPDCVVLMGEAIGRRIVPAFEEVNRIAQTRPLTSIVVLSKKQNAWRPEMSETGTARVLVQPITLRDLRREIHLAFQRRRLEPSASKSHQADAS